MDVEVSVCNGTFVIDLYCKDTDTHHYLDCRSCHMKHIKSSIPYSQTLSLRRICNLDSNFERRAVEMENWFCKRGYKRNFVKSQIERTGRFVIANVYLTMCQFEINQVERLS